jgi:hypothetical protein
MDTIRNAAAKHVCESSLVLLQVRLAAVEPGDEAVQAEIRSLQPRTISWSNVCDFYLPADFHAMAEACSAPEGGTVHHLHSMNWVRDVKGASRISFLLAADGSLERAEVSALLLVMGDLWLQVRWTARWDHFRRRSRCASHLMSATYDEPTA